MKNHIYLYSLREFEIVKDHLPLANLYNKYKHEMPPRIKHHKMMIQGYRYVMVYENGSGNPSDYMSRHPLVKENEHDEMSEQWDIDVDTLVRWMMPDAITLYQIKQETQKSKEMSELKECIHMGYLNKENEDIKCYAKIFGDISVENGLILRDERLVVPLSLRKIVVGSDSS